MVSDNLNTIYWLHNRSAEMIYLLILFQILWLLWLFVCLHANGLPYGRIIAHALSILRWSVLMRCYATCWTFYVPIKVPCILFTSRVIVMWHRNGCELVLVGEREGGGKFPATADSDGVWGSIRVTPPIRPAQGTHSTTFPHNASQSSRREPQLTFRCQYLHVIGQVCACVCARMIVLSLKKNLILYLGWDAPCRLLL